MYYIFMTIASAAFIFGGASNIDSGYLWTAMLAVGGFFFGHVVTEALNERG
jgi:hypothetical protein